MYVKMDQSDGVELKIRTDRANTNPVLTLRNTQVLYLCLVLVFCGVLLTIICILQALNLAV